MADNERTPGVTDRVSATLRSMASGTWRWLRIGYRDWECPRCGTIVRAGQRQCVLCGNDFDV